jgi:hypothetical protein
MVPKPKTQEWRVTQDFRGLNECSESKGFPLPVPRDIFNRIGAKRPKYFGIMDLTAGYHQAPMGADSIKYTAFICFLGVFEWLRLPMGLKSAPAYFQAMMVAALVGLIYLICEVYLDDIIVHGGDEAEFIKHLRMVFQRLKEKNITVNPKKCKFGLTRIEYIGHVLSQEGLTMSDEKIRKVVDFPKPLLAGPLKSFVGLVNYFHDHIPNHSTLMKPLNDLLVAYNRNNKLTWTPEAISAFELIKTKVAECQLLSFLSNTDPVYLMTDASKYGIGAYLMELVDGQEKPIRFLSKALTPSQQKWSTITQECYAIFYAITELEYLLRGRKFTLRTDHDILRHFNLEADDKVVRWKIAIQSVWEGLRKHGVIAVPSG